MRQAKMYGKPLGSRPAAGGRPVNRDNHTLSPVIAALSFDMWRQSRETGFDGRASRNGDWLRGDHAKR